jgi:hypothetical protein
MPLQEEALQALQPMPRYGSHLGAVIREHVERMQTLKMNARKRCASSCSPSIFGDFPPSFKMGSLETLTVQCVSPLHEPHAFRPL